MHLFPRNRIVRVSIIVGDSFPEFGQLGLTQQRSGRVLRGDAVPDFLDQLDPLIAAQLVDSEGLNGGCHVSHSLSEMNDLVILSIPTSDVSGSQTGLLAHHFL